MRTLMISLFLLMPLLNYGQFSNPTDEQVNVSGASKLIFVNSIIQAIDLANTDITKDTPFLLLQGGIAPVIYVGDTEFQNRFRIFYYDYGCTGPSEQIAIEYNRVMFKYLTQRYGK